MQAQLSSAIDGIVVFPFFSGPITARSKQAVQDSEEDRPLKRELKLPLAQQSDQDFVDRTGLPEALKNEGWADPGGASRDALTAGMSSENGEFLREAAERVEEGINVAAGQKLIEATETMQYTLLDLTVNPMVVDDEEIGAGTVGLSANEQSAAPVSS
jgi:hypothetical protein